MSFDFNNNIPIYLQIIEYIKIQIVSNNYKSGDRIPSVRVLSIELGVNPNTIQKALAELEELGLIITERTNGKFVTTDLRLINNIKRQMITEKLNDFYISMEKIGFNKKDIKKLLIEMLED